MDGTNLFEQRKKNLPQGISTEGDNQSVNGGIGDGVNDGGPAYCIDTYEADDKNS